MRLRSGKIVSQIPVSYSDDLYPLYRRFKCNRELFGEDIDLFYFSDCFANTNRSYDNVVDLGNCCSNIRYLLDSIEVNSSQHRKLIIFIILRTLLETKLYMGLQKAHPCLKRSYDSNLYVAKNNTKIEEGDLKSEALLKYIKATF